MSRKGRLKLQDFKGNPHLALNIGGYNGISSDYIAPATKIAKAQSEKWKRIKGK